MGLRLDKEALFTRLGYEPHPGQLLVHRSKAPRRVLACGVRWGKSTCAAMEAIAAAMEPRETSLGWVVGPSYDLAELIFFRIHRTIEEHLAHRLIELNPRKHLIRLRNLGGGVSDIRARSADNPESLLGEGLDWLILDEAARLRAEIWESHLSQRLVDRKGWALLISTPKGKNWLYRLWKRGQSGRDAEYESWNCPAWTAPHLDRETIDRERGRLGDEVFRQEYGAEFIGQQIEPCDACGDPDPAAVGAVLLEDGQELRRCGVCQAPVNGRARALRRLVDGRPFFFAMRLSHERAEPKAGNTRLDSPSPPAVGSGVCGALQVGGPAPEASGG